MSRHFDNLRKIFEFGVKSVQPSYLIKNTISIELNSINVNETKIDINEQNKFHLIGFGKAVYSMAIEMEKILGNNLKSGIISVPIGTMDKVLQNNSSAELKSVLSIYEAAANNLPDEASINATQKIMELAKSMTSEDILFVLISGGGSALLSSPKLPVTLPQKLEIISNLQKNGASIEELNAVRIALSSIKGGKLSILSKNADKIITMIISDIVDDKLHFIASGPTVKPNFDGTLSKKILEKYSIWNELEDETQNLIKQQNFVEDFPENNFVYLIGSNKIAVDACAVHAKSCNYIPIILSTKITGNVSDMSQKYIELIKSIKRFQKNSDKKEIKNCLTLFEDNLLNELTDKIERCKNLKLPILIILSGEPTVIVNGSGRGGRNQELALRIALELYNNLELNDVAFLSAGTDGIDGPTDAAGGLGSFEVIESFLLSKDLTAIENILKNNDSYNFYHNLDLGKYHIKTGHTGTNVMDIHLIAIPYM